MTDDDITATRLRAIDCLEKLKVEQLRSCRIDAEHRRLVAVPLDRLADEWAETSSEIWIDIQSSHPDEFRAFLEMLELHPLIVEDCLEPLRSSRFSSYDASLHFEVPVLSDDAADHYLSVICLARVLITIRTTRVPGIDGLLQDLDRQVPLNDGTKSALLYAILDALTDRLVQAAANARFEIRRMSRSMDEDSNAVSIEDIVSVKRNVQDLTTIAEDQLFCISSLVPVDTDAFPISSQRDYYRDAARNYQTALRVLHRYEARAAELHQQFLSSLQARTEFRIRVLTILSSICMPLTLIAGIYGMNFARMPETQSPWGYPLTLLAMCLIAIGQLWFFRRHGWFE